MRGETRRGEVFLRSVFYLSSGGERESNRHYEVESENGSGNRSLPGQKIPSQNQRSCEGFQANCYSQGASYFLDSP